MFTSARIALLAATTGIVASCGVIPSQVQYGNYSAQNDGGATEGDQYVFRNKRSILLIKNTASGFTVNASPSESTPGKNDYSPLFTIYGKDNWHSTTQLKITYLDNTKLPDVISVTTNDNLADTISKIGQVAVAVAPVVAGVVSGHENAQIPVASFLPTTLDPAVLKDDKPIKDPVNNGFCLQLSDRVAEPGIPIADYIQQGANRFRKDFPVPACETGQVTISQCSADGKITKVLDSVTTTYASENLVVPLPLPSTGSLKMNSVCGANVTPADKEDRTDLTNYLTALMKDVGDVQAAIKNAKKK